MPETPATGSTATTQRCDPHPIQGDDRGAGGARLHSIGRPRRAPVGVPEVYTSEEYASEEHRQDSEPNACVVRHRGCRSPSSNRACARRTWRLPDERARLPPRRGAGDLIDQPVGRRVVLDEAARDAIPEHILAAFREHDVKTLGCLSVEITNWADCEPLRYTAELEVRPRITLPDLASIEVVVDEVQVVEGVRPPRHVRDGSVRSDRSAATHLLGVRQRLTSTEPHASVPIG
jgi:hypothetical protein